MTVYIEVMHLGQNVLVSWECFWVIHYNCLVCTKKNSHLFIASFSDLLRSWVAAFPLVICHLLDTVSGLLWSLVCIRFWLWIIPNFLYFLCTNTRSCLPPTHSSAFSASAFIIDPSTAFWGSRFIFFTLELMSHITHNHNVLWNLLKYFLCEC